MGGGRPYPPGKLDGANVLDPFSAPDDASAKKRPYCEYRFSGRQIWNGLSRGLLRDESWDDHVHIRTAGILQRAWGECLRHLSRGHQAGWHVPARFDSTHVSYPAISTSPPQKVALAVLRAIKRDLPEVIVSPTPMKPFMAFQALSPRLVERLLPHMGGDVFKRAAQVRQAEAISSPLRHEI